MGNPENTTIAYTLRDGNGDEKEITATSLSDAREQAADWARGGDWNLDEGDETIWVKVYITDKDGDDIDSVRVAIDPIAPKCSDGGRDSHNWQSPVEIVGGIKENPGVCGHGGGVTITDVCMACGAKRVRDTWAQDRSTGEQGLDSVRYEARAYASEVRAMREESDGE